MMRAPLAAALAALAAGCTQEYGPLMSPGEDCLACHDGQGEAPRWTAAGTWSRGAHVDITDANGRTISLRGNKVGNFYTAEPLTPPFRVSVDGVEMVTTLMKSGGRVQYGGCNLCHAHGERHPDPELMGPGRDCLACHRAGGVASTTVFTAAGTWTPGQGDVVLVDAQGRTVRMQPNAVGNFHTSDPLAFPLGTVEVGTSRMGEQMPLRYGGCNACHGSGGEDHGG